MLTSNKKRVTLVLAVIGAIAMASAAVAYWTAGGSGTGSAGSGTTTPLTAVQTSTVAGMYPGDSAQTLTGKFNNPNAGPAFVASVTASIASAAKAVGAPAGTCDVTDYTLAGATMAVNAEVAAGNAQGAWTGATIKFNNKAGADQNACKGATVNLSYAIS